MGINVHGIHVKVYIEIININIDLPATQNLTVQNIKLHTVLSDYQRYIMLMQSTYKLNEALSASYI